MEDVARWRIVDDDRLTEITSDLAEILDVISLMIVATFSEQSVMDNMMDVELIQERISVLADRRGKYYNLVQLADSLQKRVDTGSLDNIDVVILALDLDWDGKVGLVKDLRTHISMFHSYRTC